MKVRWWQRNAPRINLLAFSTMTAQFSVPPRTIRCLGVCTRLSKQMQTILAAPRSNLVVMFWVCLRQRGRWWKRDHVEVKPALERTEDFWIFLSKEYYPTLCPSGQWSNHILSLSSVTPLREDRLAILWCPSIRSCVVCFCWPHSQSKHHDGN